MNDDIFIGARSLGDEVEFVLPTYNIMKQQIEDFRDNAEKVHKSNTPDNKQYNNTISIFGSRGTGKTSVIYTLMDELKNNKNNIILPIIEPDGFGENTKILGSIIGFLGDAIREKLKELKDDNNTKDYAEYFNNCIYKENNPLNTEYQKLIEYYSYTEKRFQELLIQNFDDYATYYKKSSSLLKPDVVLMDKLKEVFDKLVDFVRKFKQCSSPADATKSTEPLLFIFIDDIDLKTQKCKELIDSIMQYTNHPNVVTVLSGDLEILKESIALSLLSNEHLHDSNLNSDFKINDEISIWDRKKGLSIEYIKKIIPPALRHNLIKWNIDTIPKFSFVIADKRVTLCDEIHRLFVENVVEKDNFFGYKSGNYSDIEQQEKVSSILPIKYAYCIFDDKPRGLVNTYYYIHNFKKGDNGKCDFTQVKALIDTIVQSSSLLVDKQKVFYDKCLIWGKDENTSMIEYNGIVSNFFICIENKPFEEIANIKCGIAFFSYVNYY